jgi:hypothetical protein
MASLRSEPVAWDDRRKEQRVSNLTAAPFHQFDGSEGICENYVVLMLVCSEGR